MVTEKQIKLKDGRVLPAGLPVQFEGDKRSSTCLVRSPDRAEPYRVRITSAFQVPDMNEIADAVNDGVCLSVLGESVEPDGWDCHGSPSWLLALGMI